MSGMRRFGVRFVLGGCFLLVLHSTVAQNNLGNEASFQLPQVGLSQLQILAPKLLELTLITTKKPAPARTEQWDFVTDQGGTRLPALEEFLVSCGDNKLTV